VPELPEVENVAAALRLNLLGRPVTGLRVRFGGVFAPSARAVRAAILGKTLREVHRHGKYLILTFAADPSTTDSTETHLMLHLRMTGQVFVLAGYRPDKHVHAIFDFDGLAVHYRDIRKFGRFTLVDDPRQPSAIDHVGPDMLAVRFGTWHRSIAHRRAPIKALLLDQGIAAGLGNIYVDEALFRTRIHPLTTPVALTRTELHEILRSAKAVLRLAIRHGGTTFLNFTNFHGQPGNFRRKLRVYGRTAEPCYLCGTPIARLRIAGRSSHYCPHCQPGR
jgi:formamidopyrimidine-DNA glycosylase